jgi:hypothetical protein
MIRIRRFFFAGAATLLIASGCTSISIPSIPPINFPSIPPIDFGAGGSNPPFVIPGFSIPPGDAACVLVTGAEVAQILGTQVTDVSDSTTDCTFITPTFTTLGVSADSTTDLSGLQLILGNSAQQTTIAGFPALTGTAFGLPVVYVQKPTGQLQVLGFLTGNDADTMAKLQQIAALAVGRMP